MKLPKEKHYDAIVIGSGIGGLTTASLLARLGKKRVLVMERHFKVGGFTHIFKRQGFHWDVGIHYVGGMQQGGMLRYLIDFLTDKKVDWNQMPNPFERFIYPDFSFDVYYPEERYRFDLTEKFPSEKKAIDQYFEDVKKMSAWFGMHVTMKNLPPLLEKISSPIKSIGISSPLMTTKEYMDTHFKDPLLKAVLLSQWGDYGLPPSKSAFVIHSLIVSHYLDGGYYPKGGSNHIAASIIPSIEEVGGEILVCHEARQILIKDGKAVGVQAMEIQGDEEKGLHEFYAPIVVSNTGAYSTYTKLLSSYISEQTRQEVESTMDESGISNLTLYLGLSESVEKLGIKGENYWIYSGIDHDENFSKSANVMNGEPSGVYVSFPSIKAGESHKPTAEIISFVDYNFFSKWANQPWKNRDQDYQNLKERLTETLLSYVESHIPGFRSLVTYSEMSTPVTVEHFTDHKGGRIYGMPSTANRFRREWMGSKTQFEGVYLTGADASSPGFAGALMGGFAAVTNILGFRGLVHLLKMFRN